MRLSKLTEKDLSGLLKKTRDTYQIRLIVAYQARLVILSDKNYLCLSKKIYT